MGVLVKTKRRTLLIHNFFGVRVMDEAGKSQQPKVSDEAVPRHRAGDSPVAFL